jgi:hypothetical protein
MMKFCFQDPNIAQYNLHEEILLSSVGATDGAGVFAFVTSGGVKLLLMDDFFVEFIQSHTFNLVVGTDEITNAQTIETLCNYVQQYPNLRVKAFLNPLSNATFHPKYCWFKHSVGGQAIVGSGNLTQQGLRKNWEAFTVLDLSSSEFNTLESQWNHWFVQNLPHLKDINDPLISEKVALNNRLTKKTIPVNGAKTALVAKDEDFQAWTFDDTAQVLLAEIPRASNRWNQVNFDKNSFESYFGAKAGDNTMRIVFKGIKEDGLVQEAEIRQSVSVKSHNWRFELDLAKDKEYPDDGRPIGVFVKVAERNFLYMIKMPSDNNYDTILSFLPTSTGVRRFRITAGQLRKKCSKIPMLKYRKMAASL